MTNETVVIKTNVPLTDAQMVRLQRRHALLEELKELDALDKAEGIRYVMNPFAKAIDSLFWAAEAGVIKIGKAAVALHNKILNSKPVKWGASKILTPLIDMMLALQEVTYGTIRLYVLEGKQMAVNTDDDGPRLTLYSYPLTAASNMDYKGDLAGRMMYVDLKLDFCSNFNYRHYSWGDGAYVLKGDLIKIAKRKAKYASAAMIAQSEIDLYMAKAAAVAEL